jgi:hypothetical protein
MKPFQAFFLINNFMKYSKWIGVIIYIMLIGVCFMPWTYHADLNVYFSGFFSQNNVYGKPGKYFIIFSLISIVLMFIPKVWAKFTHLFFAGIIMAYALKTYHLFASSYNAYSPEKQPGIYALVALTILSFVIALLPDMKLKKK